MSDAWQRNCGGAFSVGLISTAKTTEPRLVRARALVRPRETALSESGDVLGLNRRFSEFRRKATLTALFIVTAARSRGSDSCIIRRVLVIGDTQQPLGQVGIVLAHRRFLASSHTGESKHEDDRPISAPAPRVLAFSQKLLEIFVCGGRRFSRLRFRKNDKTAQGFGSS